MNILVIDNYDSFVYNLVHMFHNLSDAKITVVKNDKVIRKQLELADKILLSPGPGIPKEAGKMPSIVAEYAPQKSILGVCLGHQAMAENFGAKLHNLSKPLHGISSELQVIEADYLFEHLPSNFQIGHYHSWVVEPNSIPTEIEILAKDNQGNIMAIRHRKYDIRGVQFHPESVLTKGGKQLIQNWLNH